MSVVNSMYGLLRAVPIAIVTGMLLSCAPAPKQEADPVRDEVQMQQKAQNVSLVQLIADSDRVHGQLVRVEGFGVIEFEYAALLLSAEDAKYMMSKNGVWLDLTEEQFLKYTQLTERHVLVEGVFRQLPEPGENGRVYYGGAFSTSGSIEEIVSIEPLLSREELEEM